MVAHAVKDHKRCLNIYSKLLKPGGLLIIEDISCIKDAKAIISAFDGRQNKCSIIDRTHCVPSLDDINVIYYDPRETILVLRLASFQQILLLKNVVKGF